MSDIYYTGDEYDNKIINYLTQQGISTQLITKNQSLRGLSQKTINLLL